MKDLVIYCVSFLILIILVPDPASAQWSKTLSQFTYCSAGNDSFLFAGTGYGVYLSTNDGLDWKLTDSTISRRWVWSLAVRGSNIFAGTDSGVLLSINNGASWRRVDGGLANELVTALAVIDSNVFAGMYYNAGIIMSTDLGEHWKQSDSGLTDKYIRTMTVNGVNIFAGTNFSGVFGSSDSGRSWQHLGLSSYDARGIAVNNHNVFVGTNSGVFRSSDDGHTWKAMSNGLPDTTYVEGYIVSLCGYGPNIFAAAERGNIYYASEHDTAWRQVDDGFPVGSTVSHLDIIGKYIYATDYDLGLWRRPLSEMITGINEIPGKLPSKFALKQNCPNPFNPSTMISYELPFSTHVKITVYNITGQEITTLVNEEQHAGSQSVKIDMNNYPSGVYFYRLTAGTFTEMKKMILIR
jgi:photosystem II stability/assembly factor-like uncharacterized protein